jgi:hypothetical protein
VTSATTTWDIVHVLLRLLDDSDWSSFHHCPRKCMFSFENDPNVEVDPNASNIFFSEMHLAWGYAVT